MTHTYTYRSKKKRYHEKKEIYTLINLLILKQHEHFLRRGLSILATKMKEI